MDSKTRILDHLQGIAEWRSGKDGEPVLTWVENRQHGDGLVLIQDEGFGTWIEISHSFQQAYATISVRAYPVLSGFTPDLPLRAGLSERWVTGKSADAQLKAARGWAAGYSAMHQMRYGDQEDCQALFSLIRQLCAEARKRLALQRDYYDDLAHQGHVSCTPEGCVVR